MYSEDPALMYKHRKSKTKYQNRNFFHSGFVTIKPPACMASLGLENNEIPDSSITASSEYDSSKASQGRLYQQGGWATGNYVYRTKQWFQVDFVNWTKVTGVAIQGHSFWNRWVTRFKLSYSHDEVFFSDYREDSDNAKVLSECPVRAAYISTCCPMFFSLGTGLRNISACPAMSVTVLCSEA